jgi:hypothetical protein
MRKGRQLEAIGCSLVGAVSQSRPDSAPFSF